MDKKAIYISQGNRPLWQLIIAAFMFTSALVFTYMFFDNIELLASKRPSGVVSWLELAFFAGATGIGFSVVKDYHFDFENNRFKKLLCIGPIKIGKWKPFQNLEYVSVFKNQSDDFEVNLWYNKNRHFNISEWGNSEEALHQGKQIAKVLHLNLVDASNPHNSKWVDLN